MTLPLLALLLGAGPGLVPVPALEKVRPFAPVSVLGQARLRAARGECEGLQVLVSPGAHVTAADASPLVGAGPPIPVRVHREAWMDLTRASTGGATGAWPDPLLPVLRRDGTPNPAVLPADSTAERPLVLYLEVCVPAESPPGRRTARLRVETPQGRSELPLTLDVAPVTLPATSSLPNAWGLGIYVLAHQHHVKRDSPAGVTLLRAYARALLEHRLSGYGLGIDPLPSHVRPDGGVEVDFSGYDDEVGAVMSGTALPSDAQATTAEVRDDPRLSPDRRVAYLRAWREHFQARGWRALLYLYAKDEPTLADEPTVRAQSSTARAAGLPVVVTSWRQRLWDAADVVTPVLSCFWPRPGEPTLCPGTPESAARVRTRLRPGQRLWWYQSCTVHGCDGPPRDARLRHSLEGWASYMIDASGPRNRAMGVLAWLAGVDGELYFDTLAAWEKDGQPWRDVWRFGGNGDGTFFYPGTSDVVGTEAPLPVASLRLKTVRDGLEDLELLRLVESRQGRPAAEALARRLARSGWDITPDVRAWDEVHGALLDAASSSVRRP